MARFLPQNTVRLFTGDGDLRITHLGYNDFSLPDITPVKSMHTQPYYTLHYVLNGSGTLFVEDTQFPLQTGSLFFLPPDVPMMYYPNENDPWEYIWFTLNGSQADGFGRRLGLTPETPTSHTPGHPALRRTLERLFAETESPVGDPHDLALAALYEFLYYCGRAPQVQGISAVRDFLDENYASPDFSIEQLCSTMNISHSHLCRQFKATYKIPVIRYLIDKRLTLARHLLTATELSVKSVAFSCGFNDELHFMKAFKAATGQTATAYRQTHREEE